MLSNLANLIQPFHVMELVKQADLLAQQGHPVIHLSIGEPDFALPEPVLQAHFKALRDGKTRYTAALGLPELRAAVAEHYRTSFGVVVPQEQVVITAGGSAALLYACLSMVNPGQGILLTDPGYPCNKTFVQVAGGTPQFVAVDEKHNFQPTWDDLEDAWQANTAGALLASPSNPTGTQIPESAMRKIVDGMAGRRGVLMVDEIYQSLCYDSPPRSVLQITGAPLPGQSVVVINSFSKYFGLTGLRLGWMVVPPQMVAPIERFAQNLSICPSAPAQWAALACFEPETLAMCEARRQEFKRRRDYMLTALPKAGIDVHSRPDGAFYLYTRAPYNSDHYCKDLLNTSWVCTVPGKDFSSTEGDQMMRWSYANSLDKLEEAMHRLHRFNSRL
ncbi:MAG TPA: aminotransferase class I/II-fold pyridoxal phosphate-dependent enzyme [Limnobacter sp.]|nr:aminotransferase class I/II-fold pyridoxal phosphate-dependent enzyme [Limnobacter sp.]